MHHLARPAGAVLHPEGGPCVVRVSHRQPRRWTPTRSAGTWWAGVDPDPDPAPGTTSTGPARPAAARRTPDPGPVRRLAPGRRGVGRPSRHRRGPVPGPTPWAREGEQDAVPPGLSPGSPGRGGPTTAPELA